MINSYIFPKQWCITNLKKKIVIVGDFCPIFIANLKVGEKPPNKEYVYL